jgi:hypothetical protein
MTLWLALKSYIYKELMFLGLLKSIFWSPIMNNTSFFSGHSFAKLWALSLLIVGSAAIGATNVYFGINDQVSPSLNNPHRIPDYMDPKSQALSREIQSIKYEVKDEMSEVVETIHDIAFRNNHSESIPILDYTTGTSN